ncbi:MAG: tRNA (adenosine(37)-N6)-dimethylallyltransferase MiaA [Patescibacteria group bacterium]
MIPNSKILVILGPTATGKSALAVAIAKKFNGEIISADSRQVYTGLNIGTGKVTKKEMCGIPHHLLDVANPKKRFTVVDFQKHAREKIAEIFSRGHLPIICGGTGFYIEALVDNVILPDVPPNETLRASLRGQAPETLIATLMKLDPLRAKNIDPKNSRRIIRAIEVATALGAVPPISKTVSPFGTLHIGLTLPAEELKKKIAARLSVRLKIGMITEAKRLHAKGLSWKRMEELGLEYRYLALFLQNKISKTEMITRLQYEIWHYARRQMTWFSKNKQIHWFKPKNFSKIQTEIKNFLEQQ